MTHDFPEARPAAIGERLLLTRTALGLSQKEFARRARISPSAYNHLEAGRHRPSIENALALRAAYGLTLDWIYGGDPSGLRYVLWEAVKALRTARN